jgi:hypothetical protein
VAVTVGDTGSIGFPALHKKHADLYASLVRFGLLGKVIKKHMYDFVLVNLTHGTDINLTRKEVCRLDTRA